MHGVDLREGAADGLGAGNVTGNPNCKENRVHSAFAEARKIDGAIGMARAEIKSRIEKALRGIDVRIDHEGLEMKIAGAAWKVRLRGAGGHKSRR